MPPEKDEPMEMKVLREEVVRKTEESASRHERQHGQGPTFGFQVNTRDGTRKPSAPQPAKPAEGKKSDKP